MAGIVFWFLIGFPFAHQNESYGWIVALDRLGFLGALGGFPEVAGRRPVATGLAWLMVRASQGSIVPVELLNFALTLGAWWVAARASRSPRAFALFALIAGGACFAGYIFLFHLHGIFYGPLLLLVAALAVAARSGRIAERLPWWFALALAAALIHPYALAFFVAAAMAAPLEHPALRGPRALAGIAAAVALAVLAVRVLVPVRQMASPIAGLPALVTSYRMVEVHPLVSLVALATAALAAALAWPGTAGRVVAVLTAAIGGVLLRAHLPVLPLWALVCLLQAATRGRWILAALLAAAFVLPLANPTGSPTYTIFAILLCAMITSWDAAPLEDKLSFLGPRAAWSACGAAIALAVAMRAGLPVPGIAPLARPLLAERERTHQLESLMDEFLRSPWREHPVRLYRAADSPVFSNNALERRHRPPTQELFFGPWVDWRRGQAAVAGDTLLVTFGDDSLPGAQAVLRSRGRFAGEAVVYREPNGGVPPLAPPGRTR